MLMIAGRPWLALHTAAHACTLSSHASLGLLPECCTGPHLVEQLPELAEPAQHKEGGPGGGFQPRVVGPLQEHIHTVELEVHTQQRDGYQRLYQAHGPLEALGARHSPRSAHRVIKRPWNQGRRTSAL